MTELLPISGCTNPQRVGDVIFVHGLGGNGRQYWESKDQARESGSWLNWLGHDRPDLGIWSLDYEVEPFFWKGGTMPLVDRAKNVLDLFSQKTIGHKPIVFVTHSLGGLLVKQMLRSARDSNDQSLKELVPKTQGIVFLSTPHSGSDLASFMDFLGGLLGSTVSVQELKANDSRLRELNEYFRENFYNIPLKIYFETKPVPVRKGLLGRFMNSMILVVDESSADPGITGVRPVPVDRDHISICQPLNQKDQVYGGVKKFIAVSLKPDQDPPKHGKGQEGNTETILEHQHLNTAISNPTGKDFYLDRIAAKEEELSAIKLQLRGTLSRAEELKLTRDAEALIKEIDDLHKKL